MHRVNAGYTLLVPLLTDRVATVGALLAEYDKDRGKLPFERCETVHFATVTVIPAQRYRDEDLPATLLVATSFSGPASVHVDELVRVVGPGLRPLFECCEGFGRGQDLAEFIRDHRHGDTFYSGMQNLAPEDVRRHRQLRDAIEDFLESRRGSLPDTATGVRNEIQSYVRTRPELRWAQDSFAPPRSAFFALHWRSLIIEGVLLALLVATLLRFTVVHNAMFEAGVRYSLLTVLVLALLVGGLLLAIREAEGEQKYVAGRQPDPHVRDLAATQNRPVINEFTIAGPIKEEGWLRPFFLRVALWLVARLAEGVPWLRKAMDIPTVATARWIAADKGRRLIFISNYTNAAEPYVRDFIDCPDGARNINLSFGFGRGYPKTRWVVRDGALTDPNGFIYVVTENQHPTAFWYGPYRDMSIDNIKVNRKIREGLFGKMTDTEAQTWLHLL
jgi:hypothetical protein